MRNWKFNHIDFSTYPYYASNDLGVFWSESQTVFKIWAPTALKVELRLYETGTGGKFYAKENLESSGNGTWKAIIKGNLKGKFYTFKINDGEWLNEVPDMYARCVGINGIRGQVYDPNETNPEHWENDSYSWIKPATDAILYEAHVRDFSIAENSGIQHKGKFLGFTERNTNSPEGHKTGLAHLLELGITHVHLLPVYDFFTVDEEHPLEKYNWGYDPLHYNSLEGSYSTNPSNGTERIKEFKQLVKSLHDSGIGVVLDVVYNHTGKVKSSVFNQTVPGYYYRQNPDGTFSNASGCGSEVATERAMVRKFIINSLKFWVSEYHIDGFRFDLMGIYDLQTMQAIRKELDKIKPGILLYGEGWAADQSPMPESNRAIKHNTPKLPGTASFSDDFRDALKGSHGNKKSHGFVSGQALREEAIKFGVVGATYHPQLVYDYVESSHTAWAHEPNQCINYASCHDNYTLWDKLKLSSPIASEEELQKMVMLAGALVLTSQGIPFLHAGVEFCRTKNGCENSYKSPDNINQIDWSLKSKNESVCRYYQILIQLRKNHPVLRMPQADLIRENLDFCNPYKPGIVSYCLRGKSLGDKWENAVLIFNGNKKDTHLSISEGSYKIIAKDNEINEDGIEEFSGSEIKVPAISMMILVKE